MRKKTHRNAIVTIVDELEATLADCANRIRETDGVLLGGDLDLGWISQSLDDVRAELAAVASRNTVLRGTYLPGNRGVQAAMRWLGTYCSRFIGVQTSALEALVDVLMLTGGAEGEDLEYLRKAAEYFEDVYEEHRKLTALALSGEDGTDAALDSLHLASVDTEITDFYRQIKEFGEFRQALTDSTSETSGPLDLVESTADRSSPAHEPVAYRVPLATMTTKHSRQNGLGRRVRREGGAIAGLEVL